MNFQQLRYVRAAVQNDLNLTRVAEELFTSQSGVSKQIRELETELGIEIFVRRGKRLIGLTPAGESAAGVIDRLLRESENLRRLSSQFAEGDRGRLIIAATHNQASYVLPPVLLRFAELFPSVEVELQQGTPRFVAETLERGEADIGIATEALDGHPHLETHPCFVWRHVAVARPGHPLLDLTEPRLADLAAYPIVTYSSEFTGGSRVEGAFAEAGLNPDYRLRALDADVIMTYARLGAGIGVVAEMAMANGAQHGLAVVPGSRALFGASTTKLALRRGTLLRNYAYRLVEMLAPHLDARVLSGAVRPRKPTAPPTIATFQERPDLLFSTVAQDETKEAA